MSNSRNQNPRGRGENENLQAEENAPAAAAPVPPRSNRGGNNRGRGNHRQQPRNQARGNNNNQERAPASSGPPPLPTPQHMAKTNSKEQNDPLYQTAFFPNPGDTLAAVPGTKFIHPACSGIMDIITAEYREMSARSFTLKRNIPESAYAYYAAVLTWARMLAVNAHNSGRLSHDERQMIEFVKKFKPPKLLGSYIAGFGDTDYSNGLFPERFHLLKPVYVTSQEGLRLEGYFGDIQDNPQKYANYPCIAVFAQRITQDLQATMNHDINMPWRLPPDIQLPECPELTQSCIGYKPATEMDRSQSTTLQQCGIFHNAFGSSLEDICYNEQVMVCVQSWVDEVNNIKTMDFPITSMTGSRGQLVLDKVYQPAALQIDAVWQGYLAETISGPLDYAGSTFKYRVHKMPVGAGALAIKRMLMPYAIMLAADYPPEMNELLDADDDPKLHIVANGHTQPFGTQMRLKTMSLIDFS